jgi:hypothetical protein
MTAIAQGDGATAWVASLANHSAWDIGLCSTRVQDEVLGANADSLVCGSRAPAGTAVAVDGGARAVGCARVQRGRRDRTRKLAAVGALAKYYEVCGVDRGYNLISDTPEAVDVTRRMYAFIADHVADATAPGRP